MAAEIIALVCPVCGAPLSEASSKCEYCGSLVTIRSDSVRIHPAQLNQLVIRENIDKHRDMIRRDPNDETAHYGLGLAYFNLGLVNEAADELTQAARLTPENPSIQTQLAIVYAEIARSGAPEAEKRAEDRLGRALRLDPRFADALMLRARLAGERGDWASAVADLQVVARQDPEQAEPELAHARARLEQARAVSAHRTPILERVTWPPGGSRPTENPAPDERPWKWHLSGKQGLIIGGILLGAIVAAQGGLGILALISLGVLVVVLGQKKGPAKRRRKPRRGAGRFSGAKNFVIAMIVLVVAGVLLGSAPTGSAGSGLFALVMLGALLVGVFIAVRGVIGVVGRLWFWDRRHD